MTSLPQAEIAGLTGHNRSGEDGSEQCNPLARVSGKDWARMCDVINDFRWLHGR